MPERGDLLLAEGGAGGDRAMERAIQHGTATFVAGLSASGTASNLAEATGAWRYGKRSAFPTSPHPRRRLRTNVKRGVTLTIHLVQKIGQVTRGDLMDGVIPTPGVGHIEGFCMQITGVAFCQHEDRFYGIKFFARIVPEIQRDETSYVTAIAIDVGFLHPVLQSISHVLAQAFLVVVEIDNVGPVLPRRRR